MKKYVLIDNFEDTTKVVNEKELRDLYNSLMEETIFNWKDCGDKETIDGLQKEKEEVYKVGIKEVIYGIENLDGFLDIRDYDLYVSMEMYKDFDINEFNKRFECGDLFGIEYIGKTIIKGLKENKHLLNRTDYLKGLYNAVINLNNSLIAYETGDGYITDTYFYDYYYSIRDLLFKELGLKYVDNKFILNVE